MMNSLTENRKVCCIIANPGYGLGGHYRSLKTIVEALRERVECVVINIGPYNSPVIDSIPVTVHNIRFKGLNIVGAVRQVVKILKRERIDAINVFDARIFCIADMASRIAGKPLVLTKCGGPNPDGSYFFPVVDYLVVFSKENLEYFQSHPKYANTEMRFLPNRATKAVPDPVQIEKLRARLDPRKKTFLIIARFHEHYKDNMMQGVNLVRRLNGEGKASQLLIIGTPDAPAVVDEVARYRDDSVIVVNDEEFTLDASKLIDVADFSIATGRGFMEAASRGKPLLTSLADSPFPLLVTEETFPELFATNFSPRNRIENLDLEENHRRIARALEDDGYRAELSDLASRLFNEHFDVTSVVGEYQALFSAMRYKRRLRLLTLLHGICSTLREFAPFWLPFGLHEWLLRFRKRWRS